MVKTANLMLCLFYHNRNIEKKTNKKKTGATICCLYTKNQFNIIFSVKLYETTLAKVITQSLSSHIIPFVIIIAFTTLCYNYL